MFAVTLLCLCLYGRRVKFSVSFVLCEIFVFDHDVSKKDNCDISVFI